MQKIKLDVYMCVCVCACVIRIVTKKGLLHYFLSIPHVRMNHCVHRHSCAHKRPMDPVFPPGVPTTLLVLALFFFGAAAVLGVCYVKR